MVILVGDSTPGSRIGDHSFTSRVASSQMRLLISDSKRHTVLASWWRRRPSPHLTIAEHPSKIIRSLHRQTPSRLRAAK